MRIDWQTSTVEQTGSKAGTKRTQIESLSRSKALALRLKQRTKRSEKRSVIVLDDIQLVVLQQIVEVRAECVQGEADDVVVVALDRPDQQRASALFAEDIRVHGERQSVSPGT